MKDGGPAFPIHRPLEDLDGNTRGYRGMSLRQWFAGQAISGEIVRLVPSWTDDNAPTETLEESIAKAAFRLADAMLKESDK